MADCERRRVTAPYRTSEASLRAEVDRLTLALGFVRRTREAP